MNLRIRRAGDGDADLVFEFIRALAAYERLLDQVVATPDDIVRDLFGADPRVFCEIAEWDGAPVGFALWFCNYSTFRGRHGLYLEDLFVRESHRGKGIGTALLRHLARICVDRDLGSLQWWVLDWNAPSIAFYTALGAVPQTEWTVMRVDGPALGRLADG